MNEKELLGVLKDISMSLEQIAASLDVIADKVGDDPDPCHST